MVFGSGNEKTKGKKGGGKTANGIATGGSRNTSITMTIGKFFDSINLHMTGGAAPSAGESSQESLNRALAIATSTDR